MPRPFLTDVHAHFLTEQYVAACRAVGHESPDGMPWWPSWSVQEHLAQMAICGIEKAVLSISSPGVHHGDDDAAAKLARHVNDTAARIVADDPTSFDFLASLPLPDVAGAATEAIRAIDDLGALGVILMSNAGGRYLGHPDLDPLWQVLDERQALVLVHPTSPPGWDQVHLDRPRPMLEFMVETTRTVTDMIFAGVVERFPLLEVVVPHCGAALPVLTERIEMFRSFLPGPGDGPPLPATAEQQLRSCWFDLAGFAFPHHVRAVTELLGHDRLLYGSDYCWTPVPSTRMLVDQMDQADPPGPSDSWRALLQANTSRLLLDVRSA